jgi:hypothetical protein
MYKTVYLCFFHFEGYMVLVIIVTSLLWQDLNISESNLSLSSNGDCGAAPLMPILNSPLSIYPASYCLKGIALNVFDDMTRSA